VQSQLLSIDEKRGLTALTSGFKRYKTGDPYAMRASHNYTNKTPYKNTERQSQNKTVKCGYKYCGKLGHTTFECRKRKRDEEYNKTKLNKNTKTQRAFKPFSKANIRCHRCNVLGHYANECPNKKNENQQALRASVDTKLKQQNKNNNLLEEMIMMAVIDPPTKWNTRPLRPPFVEITGFKDFLPDSGATSHFVSDLNDIQNPQPCDIEVTIADGNKVRATQVGQAEINFTQPTMAHHQL
jgi:hypothetical protein